MIGLCQVLLYNIKYILNSNDDIHIKPNYLLIEKTLNEISFADNVLSEINNNNLKINSGLRLVLSVAKEAYTSYCDREEYKRKVLWILALNYVSRAYMVEACKRRSAESLNLVAMILENDYNIRLHDKIKERYGEEIRELCTFGEERLSFSFDLYDCASKLPHIVRGYSAQKKAIMLIKGKVIRSDLNLMDEIKNNLKLSGYADLPMTYYWEGRFYSDIVGSTLDAVKLFEIEQKRIIDKGHLDENNLPSNSMSLMLVKIELISLHAMSMDEKRILGSVCKLLEELNYDNIEKVHLINESFSGRLCDEINYIINCLNYQNPIYIK